MSAVSEVRSLLAQDPQLQVIDAHCHLSSDGEIITGASDPLRSISAVMSTHMGDFESVSQLCRAHHHHSRGTSIVGAFGLHPWFSHYVYDDSVGCSSSLTKHELYQRVLVPYSPQSCDPEPIGDPIFFKTLPDPMALSAFRTLLRETLLNHPQALVGECGLDKKFRLHLDHDKVATRRQFTIDMNHQKKILEVQLSLARELDRGVSIHGVACHGALHELISNSNNNIRSANGSPLRIALHSYTGSPGFLINYFPKKDKVNLDVQAYISLSQWINYPNDPKRRATFEELIEKIPMDRILTESDYPGVGMMSPGVGMMSQDAAVVTVDKRQDELMAEIVVAIARVRGWSVERVLTQVADNWKCFINHQSH